VTQPLKNLLNNNAEFRSILAKAQTLLTLQQQFCAATPAYLAQAAQVLSLEFGILTLATGNAAVAAKLRQLAPEILEKLKNEGAHVSGIRVKVQVSYPAPQNRARARQLSPTAHDTLKQFGDSLSDSPLKDALKKMSGDTPA
jgi:hypothetical protein